MVPTLVSGLALFALEIQRQGWEALSFVNGYRPRCELKDECPWYGIRPTLPDGTAASMVYDGARRLLLSDKIVDIKDLVTIVRSPPVFVYDVMKNSVVDELRVLAREALEQHPVHKPEDDNDAIKAVLECHFDDEVCNHYFPPVFQLNVQKPSG